MLRLCFISLVEVLLIGEILNESSILNASRNIGLSSLGRCNSANGPFEDTFSDTSQTKHAGHIL